MKTERIKIIAIIALLAINITLGYIIYTTPRPTAKKIAIQLPAYPCSSAYDHIKFSKDLARYQVTYCPIS